MLTRNRADFCIGVLMLVAMFQSAIAAPQRALPELRLATSFRDGSDIRLIAAALPMKAVSWTRASRMEIAVGLVDGSGHSRPFVSAGSVWQLNYSNTPVFVEFGFSPTLLGGSTLGAHDLGGNLHFTSSLAVGMVLGQGRNARIALRIQHLSNGGLHDRNPGLDLVGLNFISPFDTP